MAAVVASKDLIGITRMVSVGLLLERLGLWHRHCAGVSSLFLAKYHMLDVLRGRQGLSKG